MNGRELPEGWRWAKLSELLTDLQAGFAISARDPNGVRQLRMNNVTVRGTLDWSEYIRVPADQRTITRFSLRKGDIVFNNTNSVDLVGKSAFIIDLDEPTTFSNHFTRLRASREIEPRFLASYLRDCWQRRVFADACDRWVGQAAFQARKLRELHIPLPPAAEQRRIADAIDAAMAEAEAAREAAAAQQSAVQALLAAILTAAFQGDL